MALEGARKQSMTKDTIERAIKKGAGLTRRRHVQYDSVTYEGFTPHRVPVIVECLTDNKNRTNGQHQRPLPQSAARQLGKQSRGTSPTSASIDASPPAGKTVDPEEAAIEAGAQDLEAGEDGSTIFYTNASDVDAVAKALGELGWAVSSAKLIWKAKNPVTTLDDAQRSGSGSFPERSSTKTTTSKTSTSRSSFAWHFYLDSRAVSFSSRSCWRAGAPAGAVSRCSQKMLVRPIRTAPI
jgi:transcriptional/translational regulatory protein YebC/TACO1